MLANVIMGWCPIFPIALEMMVTSDWGVERVEAIDKLDHNSAKPSEDASNMRYDTIWRLSEKNGEGPLGFQ